MAKTLERAARRRRVQMAVISAVLVLVIAAAAAGLFLAALALSEINDTADYLKECTTPSTDVEFHRCYEDGQRRTQEAVQAIVESQNYNSALLVCLLSFPPDERTDQDIKDCERKSLEAVTEGAD